MKFEFPMKIMLEDGTMVVITCAGTFQAAINTKTGEPLALTAENMERWKKKLMLELGVDDEEEEEEEEEEDTDDD